MMLNTKIARQALDNWPGRYTDADIRLWFEKLLAEIECSNLLNDRWTCGTHEYRKSEYPDGCPYCETEAELAAVLEENERHVEALQAVATADFCSDHTWTRQPDPYRNTCCMEANPDRDGWCIHCVAAHALGWSTEKFIVETAGPEYLNKEAPE